MSPCAYNQHTSEQVCDPGRRRSRGDAAFALMLLQFHDCNLDCVVAGPFDTADSVLRPDLVSAVVHEHASLTYMELIGDRTSRWHYVPIRDAIYCDLRRPSGGVHPDALEAVCIGLQVGTHACDCILGRKELQSRSRYLDVYTKDAVRYSYRNW